MRPRSVNLARATTSERASVARADSNLLQLQRRRRPQRHHRPPPVVRVAAFDSDPLAALDKAAALLNRAIGSTSSSSSSSKSKQKINGEEVSLKPAKKRWVDFSATASSAVAVAPLLEEAAERELRERERRRLRNNSDGEEEQREQVERRRRTRIPGRDLLSYLALPASEYSLLDPAWVTRETAGDGRTREGDREKSVEEGDTDADADGDGDGDGDGDAAADDEEAFIVRFPLSDLVGIPLTPSFRVRVTSRSPNGKHHHRHHRSRHRDKDKDDEKSGVVAFSADRAALGDPSLDEAFEASVDATLSRKETKKSVSSGKKKKKRKHGHHHHGHHHHGHHHHHEKSKSESEGVEALASAADSTPSSSPALALAHDDDDDEHVDDHLDASSSLCAHVTVRARVQLSGAAASIPAPVVSLAAGLVSKAVLRASLGPFLRLLVDDYWSWSRGLERGTKRDDSGLLLPLQVAAAATDAAVAREEAAAAAEELYTKEKNEEEDK